MSFNSSWHSTILRTNQFSHDWFPHKTFGRNRFLRAFAKLRKATISFVMSVRLSFRLSVRMEQLSSQRTDFPEICYEDFENSLRKFKFHWNLTRTKALYMKTDTHFSLTFWRRNFFFILANSVYKMWITQEPKKVALWNKRHFEEKKKRRVCSMFKIFCTYICWINI